jgi:hypothetical protein
MINSKRLLLLMLLACIAIDAAWSASAMAAPGMDGPYEVKLGPKQGVVAIRVVTNRPAGLFFAKLGVLILKNLTTGKEIRINDSASDYTSFSMFVAAVPEGTYELKQFDNWSAGLLLVTQDVMVGSAIGTFQVLERRVTDLGTLAYVRRSNPVNSSEYSLAVDETEKATSYSRSLLGPDVSEALDNGALGWQGSAGSRRHPVLTAEDLATERGLINPTVDASGVLRSGVAFGQILTRSADGQWRRDKVPTLEAVTATATLKDGTLIAAADEGLIFIRVPGSEWALKPLAPRAKPVFIGTEDSGGIFVVAEVPDGVAVYHATNQESPWQETRKFEVKNSPGARGPHFGGATLTRGHLIVTTISWGFSGRKHTMNSLSFATGEWIADSTGIYGPISSFPDGGFYSMAGPNISQAMKVSMDGGRTWETRGSPNWAGQPIFRTYDVGYLIRTDHIPAVNPANLKRSLWKTIDGGRTWVPHSDLPNQSVRVVLLSGEGHLLLETNDGRVLSSMDDGETWTPEAL